MQNINGWYMLEDEADVAMLDHARRYENNTEFNQWHSDFMKEILEYHLPKNCEKRVAIDVGASYGWMTIPFSQHFEQVYAFEIVAGIRECLIKNTQNLSNVKVLSTGLSNIEGEVNVRITSNSGASAVDKIGTPLEVATLDSYNINRVDLIKLDVEGHEASVIQGAVKTIRSSYPVVIAECSYLGRSIDHLKRRQQLCHLMFDLEYRLVDVRHNDFVFLPNGKAT